MSDVVYTLVWAAIVSCIVYIVYTWRRRTNESELEEHFPDGQEAKQVPLLPERRTFLGGHVSWIKEQIEKNGGVRFAAHLVAHGKHQLPVFALQFGPVGLATRACIVTDSRLASELIRNKSIGPSQQITGLIKYVIGKQATLALSGDEWRRRRRLLDVVLRRNTHQYAADCILDITQQCLQQLASEHCVVSNENAEPATGTQRNEPRTLQRVDVVGTISEISRNVMASLCLNIDVGSADPGLRDALTAMIGHFNKLAFKPSLTVWRMLSPLEASRISSDRAVITKALQSNITNDKAHSLLSLLVNAEDDGYERMYTDGRRRHSPAADGDIDADGAVIGDSEDDVVVDNEDGAAHRTQQRSKPPQAATFSKTDIIDESLMTFVVGHKTLSCAFGWLLYHFAKHPHVQHLVYQELKNVVTGGAGKLGKAESRRPTLETFRDLTFTRWCILESIRLCPTAPLLARSATDDTIVGGYQFKKGDHILISSYLIQRSGQDWDDPDVFRPSRWDLNESGSYANGSFLGFGAGERRCPAESLVMLELEAMVVPWLLQYQIYLADEKIAEQVTFTYGPRHLLLHLEPRQSE